MTKARLKSVKVKFAPLEHVQLIDIDYLIGRVIRVIIEAGSQPIYDCAYVVNGNCCRTEFFEDELEKIL